jgi:hypothetical protein
MNVIFSFWNYSWFLVPIVGPHIGAVVGALLYQGFIGAHWPEEHSEESKHHGLDMEEMRTPLNSPSDYLIGQNGKYSGKDSWGSPASNSIQTWFDEDSLIPRTTDCTASMIYPVFSTTDSLFKMLVGFLQLGVAFLWHSVPVALACPFKLVFICINALVAWKFYLLC